MRYLTIVLLVFAAAGLLVAEAGPKDEYTLGLVAHYYKDHDNWKGNWPDDVSVPAVDAGDWTFTDYEYSRVEPLVNHLFIKKGWFTVRWVGWLDTHPRESGDGGSDGGVVNPSQENEYTFEILADDGCRLFVDGDKVIDDWKPCWEKSDEARRESKKVNLTRGTHRIVIEYFQGQSLKGDDKDPMKLYWSCRERKIPRQIVPAAHLLHTANDKKSPTR